MEHMARAEPSNAQGINSIQIGARVLQALEEGRGPIPLAEVARRSGLHPAKTHRYLTSLVRSGLASQRHGNLALKRCGEPTLSPSFLSTP
jgi:IclR helix-turn-helix domain